MHLEALGGCPTLVPHGSSHTVVYYTPPEFYILYVSIVTCPYVEVLLWKHGIYNSGGVHLHPIFNSARVSDGDGG